MDTVNSLISSLMDVFGSLYNTFGFGIVFPMILVISIGVLGQWKLYEKCGQKGIACLVPVWNVAAFLAIVGRPAWHMIYLLIPGFNIYFVIKVYIELCNSFGRKGIMDYILIIIFNGFYVLNLGLSYEAVYKGPVYNANKKEKPKQESLQDFAKRQTTQLV